LNPNHAIWIGVALAACVVAVALFVRSATRPAAPRVSPTGAPDRAPAVAPVASPEVAAAIERIKVTGLIGGDRPRAFIDGEAKRPGEVVDARRGIVLFSIDTAKRTVTFADRAGNKYTKPFR